LELSDRLASWIESSEADHAPSCAVKGALAG
jgi:hypothetical protein